MTVIATSLSYTSLANGSSHGGGSNSATGFGALLNQMQPPASVSGTAQDTPSAQNGSSNAATTSNASPPTSNASPSQTAASSAEHLPAHSGRHSPEQARNLSAAASSPDATSKDSIPPSTPQASASADAGTVSRSEADTPSKQDATTTASPDASALAVLMQWSGPSGNTASPTAGTTDSADQTQVAVTASGKSSLPALGTMQDLPTSAQDSSGTGSGDTGHLASTLQTSTTIPAVDQGQIAPHTSQASQAMTADTQAATTDFAARLAASPQEDGKSASGMDTSLASIQAATQVASQGGAGTAPVATTSAASTVTVQMDSPAFASQLSQHIGALVKQDLQQARIQVSPQGMGPIDIKLQVSNGVVDVNFAVQHPATVHAIQQTLPQLDSLMSAQGLQLGQAQVGQQSAGQTYGQDASDQPSNDRSPGTMALDAGTAEASTPVMLIQRTGRSLIDHFV